jgi:hypothetical protein
VRGFVWGISTAVPGAFMHIDAPRIACKHRISRGFVPCGQLTLNQRVAGSNPAAPTIQINNLSQLASLLWGRGVGYCCIEAGPPYN